MLNACDCDFDFNFEGDIFAQILFGYYLFECCSFLDKSAIDSAEKPITYWLINNSTNEWIELLSIHSMNSFIDEWIADLVDTLINYWMNSSTDHSPN